MFEESRQKSIEELKRCIVRSGYYVKVLVKWLLISVGIGLFVGSISSFFGHALVWANEFRNENPAIIFALPFAGMLIVFLYRVSKNTDDRGTNMVISSIHSSTKIPFKMAPLIFITTVLTHLCGGSAGREGAAIQLGGSIANRLGKCYNLNENNQRIIIMCGMSAGFSALFGTPMAAAIFALEVISIGIMHYSALVPCVTSAMIAHFVAGFFKVKPESFTVAEIPPMDPVIFFKVIVFAGLIGGVSVLFCIILHGTEHTYKKLLKNPYARIFVAGCVIIALTFLVGNTSYLGSGIEIIERIFHEGSTPNHTFLIKIIFTALTLGAGFKGGEIVPTFFVGATFGCLVGQLIGFNPGLCAAIGMISLFCGVTNCPISTLLISFELFGYAGMPYYLLAVAFSYMLSGYSGLYRSQKIMYSKYKTDFINKHTS